MPNVPHVAMSDLPRVFVVGAVTAIVGTLAHWAWQRRTTRNAAAQKLARKAHTDHTRRFGAAEKVTR